jgi:hypothetical protein
MKWRFGGTMMGSEVQEMARKSSPAAGTRQRGAGENGAGRPAKRKLQLVDPDPAVRAEQIRQNQAALRLIEEWLADESGYDERVWPIIEKRLAENPVRI